MNTVKLITTGLVLSTTAFLIGCTPQCITANYVPFKATPPQEIGARFNSHVKISDVGGMIVDGYMHGRVLLTNETDESQPVRYHFVWTSSDGLPQGENTPWTPVQIGPRFSQVVQSVAPNTEAVNYHIEVCQ